jgi:hypothetical protein
MNGRAASVNSAEIDPLRSESEQTGACNLGQPSVARIGYHIEQLFNTITSDRCDNAKLCKMGKIGRTDRLRAIKPYLFGVRDSAPVHRRAPRVKSSISRYPNGALGALCGCRFGRAAGQTSEGRAG